MGRRRLLLLVRRFYSASVLSWQFIQCVGMIHVVCQLSHYATTRNSGTLETSQPTCVYTLLLLDELSQVSVSVAFIHASSAPQPKLCSIPPFLY